MMKKVLTLTLCLLVLCSTRSTSAQERNSSDFTRRHRLPQVETNDAGEKCLNAPQWQMVIKVANQNKGLFEWRLEVIGIVRTHNAIIAKYELLIQNYELQLKIFGQRNEYLTVRLDQERKNAMKLGLEDRLEKYAMWVVILAETVVIGVMGIQMMVDGNPVN